MKKATSILVLFLGESLAIYAEIIGAKNINNNFSATFWKMFGLIILAGFLLLSGYMFGMKYIQDIWVVGAISIASIVIAEPIITYSIFHTLPSRGAFMGLVLGVLAILCALFIK